VLQEDRRCPLLDESTVLRQELVIRLRSDQSIEVKVGVLIGGGGGDRAADEGGRDPVVANTGVGESIYYALLPVGQH